MALEMEGPESVTWKTPKGECYCGFLHTVQFKVDLFTTASYNEPFSPFLCTVSGCHQDLALNLCKHSDFSACAPASEQLFEFLLKGKKTFLLTMGPLYSQALWGLGKNVRKQTATDESTVLAPHPWVPPHRESVLRPSTFRRS